MNNKFTVVYIAFRTFDVRITEHFYSCPAYPEIFVGNILQNTSFGFEGVCVFNSTDAVFLSQNNYFFKLGFHLLVASVFFGFLWVLLLLLIKKIWVSMSSVFCDNRGALLFFREREENNLPYYSFFSVFPLLCPSNDITTIILFISLRQI